MKKLSVISVLMTAIMVLSLCACGGGAGKGKTPADISMSMWEQVQKGNYEKAMDIWLDNSLTDAEDQITPEQRKEAVKAFADKMKEGHQEKSGIKEVALLSEKIDEENGTATVVVKVTYNDGTTSEESEQYKKVDGAWKIVNNMK